MIPHSFKEHNATLTKPDGMTDEECGSLEVYRDGGKVCISCWRPTLRERLSMLVFGRVWLWVYSGVTQPPVGLAAKRTIFKTVRTDLAKNWFKHLYGFWGGKR
jgi:hypothetical protein